MISEALRLIRVFHDLKQFELAEKLDVSKSYISEIENGVKAPSLEILRRYAQEFNIPVSSIVFFAEEIPTARAGDRIRSKIADKVIDILRFVERKANAESLG